MDYHAIHFVQRELLEARLDVAETRQERAEQLASQLKIVKGSLAIAEARCIAGAVSKLDVHWARADVLHVRIQLLKLAETDESKIKSSHAQSLENRRVR
jgi:outer membrane protein TolC